jgi:hypothetical protein
MNAELRELLGSADRAARDRDWRTARAAFMDAGAAASERGAWRFAVRCYRGALELDVTDRELVDRIVRISGRLSSGVDWVDYARALAVHPEWSAFGCRAAHIVLGDLGGIIACPGVGAVLELMMARDDLVDVHPDGRFAAMPLAMAMVIVRRAMWPQAREQTGEPRSISVAFAGTRRVRLDELGEWITLG